MLVNLADDGTEVGITLQVSGFLVSGTLVGGAKYFEGFASDFASGFKDPEVAESVRKSFSMGGERYKREAGEAEYPPRSYIHLKEARFFNTMGQPLPANRGVWWRGRLSEVSGFIIGSLSADR